ncbi:MAG: hypothetical protein LLF89_03355 [Spirochaetaceae bacterium]|nr:hypothetical protein [Spirochaetaceae bacterium]
MFARKHDGIAENHIVLFSFGHIINRNGGIMDKSTLNSFGKIGKQLDDYAAKLKKIAAALDSLIEKEGKMSPKPMPKVAKKPIAKVSKKPADKVLKTIAAAPAARKTVKKTETKPAVPAIASKPKTKRGRPAKIKK